MEITRFASTSLLHTPNLTPRNFQFPNFNTTNHNQTLNYSCNGPRRKLLVVNVSDGGVVQTETAVVEKERSKVVLPRFEVFQGSPTPFGATAVDGGVNFAVRSSYATSATLCLMTPTDLPQKRVSEQIPLDQLMNKTGDVWHVFLKGDLNDLLYGYKFSGEFSPEEGHYFDSSKILLDPYAKAVVSRDEFGVLGPDDDPWPQMACKVPSTDDQFDWEGDLPLKLPQRDLVIYEMHVRGFTRHESGMTKSSGTYLGVVEKLDHLKELGVNCIELMPCHEFNELEYYSYNPILGDYRLNFWGYSTINYFSPMARYASAGGTGAIDEFKNFIKEAHKRGIEVLMDVVFNHTAEGNENGPVLSFRGVDNSVFYMLAPKPSPFRVWIPEDFSEWRKKRIIHSKLRSLICTNYEDAREVLNGLFACVANYYKGLAGIVRGTSGLMYQGEFYNYSGCGNTFNCNHPVVRQFILDSLRYWVTEMHVDGFRFDLASIMTRGSSLWDAVNVYGNQLDSDVITTGTPLSNPPLIDMISNDPVLCGVKLIAEAWDCGGLYQVGMFPHWGIWSEWNGKFRDTVRQFIKGTDGFSGALAECLCGSPNLYQVGGRKPWNSINFICAHDGFTLADLVTYNDKHNMANGEDNKDGESHNNSWNCGEEGEFASIIVKRLRKRQMRNFFLCLMVSQGVPMIYMGDEYGHTKGGNNNTYCHDNYINYFRWDKKEESSSDFFRFCCLMTKFRSESEALGLNDFPTAERLQWHGHMPGVPDWSDTSRFVAFTMMDEVNGELYVAFNSSHLPVTVTLPERPGYRWEPLVDTSKPSPFDFLTDDLPEREIAIRQYAHFLNDNLYPMLSYSSIILLLSPDEHA